MLSKFFDTSNILLVPVAIKKIEKEKKEGKVPAFDRDKINGWLDFSLREALDDRVKIQFHSEIDFARGRNNLPKERLPNPGNYEERKILIGIIERSLDRIIIDLEDEDFIINSAGHTLPHHLENKERIPAQYVEKYVFEFAIDLIYNGDLSAYRR